VGIALIRVDNGEEYPLSEGEERIIGRHPDASGGIVVGERDPQVSRRHVSVQLVDGFVRVRRLSLRQDVRVVARGRQPVRLGAQGEEVALGGHFVVLLPRTPVRRRVVYYRIHVRAPALGPDPMPGTPFAPPSGGTSTREPPKLLERERRFAAAYCEPLLRDDGEFDGRAVAPASHPEAAARLGRNVDYVRKQIDDTRMRLLGEGHPAGMDKDEFCEWAVDNGLVTKADLDVLPPETPPPTPMGGA